MNFLPQASLETPSGKQVLEQLSRASAALRCVLSGQENVSHDSSPNGSNAKSSELYAARVSEINVGQLTRAFAEVDHTRKLIECFASGYPEFAVTLAEYQLLLRHFKSELPRLHGWMLTERARLASRQSHSSGVEIWLETNIRTR
ncbi:MAG TPA: hypothetical protein VH596_12845 [Terriglobales bacterium]|jgi:hypothetical protein